MLVYDERTGQTLDRACTNEVVVDVVDDNVIMAFMSGNEDLINVTYYDRTGLPMFTKLTYYPSMKDKIWYSRKLGVYKWGKDGEEERLEEMYDLQPGRFPYSFTRKYEAVQNFSIFRGKQRLGKMKAYDIEIPYTFGLEFETAAGYVPEHMCFRDGLIPLRDGSISGLEYSTVILSGNAGLSLLEQELETLKEYTYFNKECSLHVHFGGFPVEEKALWKLYVLFQHLQFELAIYLPKYAFNTGEYKANGKNYCNLLRQFKDFRSMYRALVGENYYGNLYMPHPKDLTRMQKWKIPTRYQAMNLINMLCYENHKTVEFRFLSPTYNFKKILLWLYVLSAVLEYARTMDVSEESVPSVPDLLSKIYGGDRYPIIWNGVQRLCYAVNLQALCGDYIGARTDIEDDVFKDYVIS